MRILIVEDDAELSASIAEYLELQGAECDFAYNGLSALTIASDTAIDVIVLDLMLPKLNGLDVCAQLRERGSSVPILMLTAMGTNEEQLSGFRAGVDDYVVKPCPMPLLWARLQALYNRRYQHSTNKEFGPLQIDVTARVLKRSDQLIELTATEWKIFEILLRHSPNVVSRSEIEANVWPDQEPDSGRLNVHLHGLRKALDKPFSHPLIHTFVGLGIALKNE